LLQSGNIQSGILNKIKVSFYKLISVAEMIIIIPIIILIIAGYIINPVFLTANNLLSLLKNISYLGIIAVVFTLLLAVKGLDLSVGALVGLSGVIVGIATTKWNLPVSLSIFIVFIIGLSAGIINGYLCAKVGIPSLIVTLGMQFILRGTSFILVGVTYIIGNIPESIVKFGNYKIGPFSIETVFLIILALIIDFIFRSTVLGRRIKLSGANPSVARLHGVNHQNIAMFVYIATSLAAAFAGVLFTARLGSSMPLAGYQWELRIIVACVLGGASIYGGRGSVIGTLLGVVFIATLYNVMVLANVSDDWQFFITGLILILAIMFNNTRISIINRVLTA